MKQNFWIAKLLMSITFFTTSFHSNLAFARKECEKPGMYQHVIARHETQGNVTGRIKGGFLTTFSLESTNLLLKESGSSLRINGSVNANGEFMGGLFKIGGEVSVDWETMSWETMSKEKRETVIKSANNAASYATYDLTITGQFIYTFTQGYICTPDHKLILLALFATSGASGDIIPKIPPESLFNGNENFWEME